MAKELRVGIIGASGMARAHMDAVAAYPSAVLAAVCDIDEAKAASQAENFGARVYTDYRAMLAEERLDAAIIVTPDPLHREMAVAALERGLDVLCEKPMALNMADARAMTQAADATGRRLMIGQIGRYTPGFVKAKELVDAGEIGELFFVETEYAHNYTHARGSNDWRVTPDRHGFIGGGCHAVDLLRWVAGNPTEVTAYSNHKCLTDWPCDDCTIAIMKLPSGAMGKVFVSIGCKRDYTMRSVFYGTRGTIITDNTSTFMTVYKDGLGAGDTLLEGRTTYTLPLRLPLSIANHNAQAEFREFADCILNGTPVKTDAREGAATVAVCVAAVESARTGAAVRPAYI